MTDFLQFVLNIFGVQPAAKLALPAVCRSAAVAYPIIERRAASHADSWSRIARGRRGIVRLGPPRSCFAAISDLFSPPPGRLLLAC